MQAARDGMGTTDVERAFAQMKARGPEALTRERVPANFSARVFTLDGGLSSYGTDFTNLYRQAAVYVGLTMPQSVLARADRVIQ